MQTVLTISKTDKNSETKEIRKNRKYLIVAPI